MEQSAGDTESLLLRLVRDQRADDWARLVELYQPVIYRIARRRGLQDADAQDLSQRVLVILAEKLPSWEGELSGPRFRSWLYRVAGNAISNVLTRRPKDTAGGGTTALQAIQLVPDDSLGSFDSKPSTDSEDAWVSDEEIDLAVRRQAFRTAAQRVRARCDATTWLAFAMTTIDGCSIAETAKQLGKSEGVIYAARSRVMKRLRDEVATIQGESS